MAHELDQMVDGRYAMAFTGSRNDIWHRHGQEMLPNMSVEQWADAAGLAWKAIKCPAYAQLPDGRYVTMPDRCFITREDRGAPLGYASTDYNIVQPMDVLKWFEHYTAQDDRFKLDAAGALRGGAAIWATATFNGDISVAGDRHRARLLMTTTFDGTGSTTNKGTMTRVVCNNTLQAALGDGSRAVIRTRHSGKFNAARVHKELADIAQSFDTYKAMGEAMAQARMSPVDMTRFFKAILDIPFDAPREEISKVKSNQFDALRNAYATTVQEGTERGTAWTCLNAVTRWVDHDRSVKGGTVYGSEDVARFYSANFGSGDKVKARAVELLRDVPQSQSVALSADSPLAKAAFTS